ncbi:MAG: hypothetical protein GXP42_02670 [Chloroflexi bacterium]|nr:hypothetical protein [Chloroflexota bacterium]
MEKRHRIFSRRLFDVFLLVALIFLVASPSASATPAREATLSPVDTPIEVLHDAAGLNDWTVGNGLLYWESDCSDEEFPAGNYFLKRRPLYGDATLTLEEVNATNCTTFQGIAADASGVYYVDETHRVIKRRTVDDPDVAQNIYELQSGEPRPLSDLALDQDYVYWGVIEYIYRAPKEGGQRQTVAQTVGGVTAIWATGDGVYWLDSEGLWSASVTCESLPCPKNHLVDIDLPDTARIIWYRFYSVFGLPVWEVHWVKQVSDSKRDEIHRLRCDLFGCNDTVIYTTPSHWDINAINIAGGYIFWAERRMGEGRIRRMPLSGGQATIIAHVLLPGDYLYADNAYIYFADLAQNRIYKLPFSASAVYRDLALEKWEVTQGIQSTANDVPLVAAKPTYVRVYGRLNSGLRATAAEAVLRGFRNGVELSGSPLYPVANAWQYLEQGANIDRSQRQAGWLFRLPASWIVEGELQLQAEIDPEGVYADNNPDNDTLEGTFTFTRKAPVCIVFVPVRTHAPRASTSNPNFSPMIDLAKRLWPTFAYWTWEQSEDIAEFHLFWFSPYEIPEDTWKILLSLDTRDFFTDDPDLCDDHGATTHYVGMVHAHTNTSTDRGAVLGTAWTEYNDVAWVKFPREDEQPASPADWNFPGAGLTLAHELAHNKGRKHVNCGGPEGVDNNYPYPTNQLDFTGPDRHYGFDINSRTPIAPDAASDMMSYCRPRWISDYNWKALFNRLGSASDVEKSGQGNGAAPDKWEGGALVYASGAITPTLHQGELNYAWSISPQTMSESMRRKWLRKMTLAFDEVKAADAENGPTPYHLRLVDPNGVVLTDRTVRLTEAIDGIPAGQAQIFTLVFPAPAGTVKRLELLENGQVIAAREIGPNAPQMEILEPEGGEIYDDNMTIAWRGHDPDGDLPRYQVQYSPDDGRTWRIIATDIPHPRFSDAVTLKLDDLSGLPGSEPGKARIRILASDGFHTSLAVSPAFTLTDRKPKAYIASPTKGQSFAAGELVTLSGAAMDAEDGPLSGEALRWRLDGAFIGAGEALQTAGLAPGEHKAELRANDSNNQTGSADVTFTVQTLSIPYSGAAPTLDGSCDDAVYAQAASLPLAPYPDKSQGVVRLLRTNDHLWACFDGLKRSTGGPLSFAGLRVDVDYSRDALAQQDDYGFFISEDGTAYTVSGNGAGGFSNPGPGGMVAQLATYGDDRWRMEMRIDKEVLDGWDHLIGLDLGHYWVAYQGDDYHWPFEPQNASWVRPNTWATTALGVLPQLDSLDPNSATVGDAGFTLTVHGANFTAQAQVLWDGAPLPTTYVDANTLQAQVVASRLNRAGVVDVAVRAAPNSAFVSDSSPFAILNPAPRIDEVSPDHAYMNEPGFTLVIKGADFAVGATAYWDDEPLPTTYIDKDELRAMVAQTHLQQPGPRGVTVINPGPGGGASNTVFVRVEQLNMYLPMMRR